jgi:glycosyltransferase involved in cell wall biosynthesis
MEAMAAGLPIVASKIRGNVDLIDENKGGILVCPDNISGFTNAINSILNSNKLEKFGYYNKQKIKDYSIDNVLNKVTEIYKNT